MADRTDPALLSRQLVVLMRLVWGSGRATFTPHELLTALWWALPQFEGHEQHDSQELLIALLNRLQEEERYLIQESMTPTNVVEEMFQGETSTMLRYRSNGKRVFLFVFFCFFFFVFFFVCFFFLNIEYL